MHTSSSKQLREIFLPNGGADFKGVDIRQEIELKVRQLLGRTELKDIAGSAKVLVEISDHTSSQKMFKPEASNEALSPTGLHTRKVQM